MTRVTPQIVGLTWNKILDLSMPMFLLVLAMLMMLPVVLLLLFAVSISLISLNQAVLFGAVAAASFTATFLPASIVAVLNKA